MNTQAPSRELHVDDVLGALKILREAGAPFGDCLALAKKIGDAKKWDTKYSIYQKPVENTPKQLP